jgi:hypothetical protein
LLDHAASVGPRAFGLYRRFCGLAGSDHISKRLMFLRVPLHIPKCPCCFASKMALDQAVLHAQFLLPTPEFACHLDPDTVAEQGMFIVLSVWVDDVPFKL